MSQKVDWRNLIALSIWIWSSVRGETRQCLRSRNVSLKDLNHSFKKFIATALLLLLTSQSQVRSSINVLNTASIASLLLSLWLVRQSLRSTGLKSLLIPSGDSSRQQAFPTTFSAPSACILSCLVLSRVPGSRQIDVRVASPNFGSEAFSLLELSHLEWSAIFFEDGSSFRVLLRIFVLYLRWAQGSGAMGDPGMMNVAATRWWIPSCWTCESNS